MKRTRSFRLVAAGVVVALTSAVAVTTTTQTASANDFQIIQDNLDDALGVLLEGVAASVEDYLASQSFQSAATVLSDALVAAGQALVAGTADFAPLALGIALFVSAMGQNQDAITAVLDDPTLAADLLSPEDVAAIAQRIVPVLSDILTGGSSVTGVAADLLEGRLMGSGSFQYFFGCFAICGIFKIVGALLYGLLSPEVLPELAFPWSSLGTNLFGALDGFAGTYFASIQANLQPLLQGDPLGAVTGPIAGLLDGLDLDLATLALPIPLDL